MCNCSKKLEFRFSRIKDVEPPFKKHKEDAGIDFYVPNDFKDIVVNPNETVVIPLGIKVQVPKGYALVFFNRGSVAVKKGLTVGACVIDEPFQGEVILNLINETTYPTEIKAGEKIIQGLLIEVPEVEFNEVPIEELYSEKTARGEGMLGSTNE
ncbi:hypothetical protein [uncultured Arcobacter sp.]|uniref:dUTP diphosphatase n=1 Tax=uncultured Arcobacter sp. TaxID=165434 RepID=UPI0026333D8B|nr:hypothetical protein [uncultured Arcobacter sp.]